MKHQSEGRARMESWALRKQGIVREPLITFKELCSKYDVTEGKMVALFRMHPDHPKKVMMVGSKQNKNSWFKPKEFEAWFKSIKDTL